MRPVRVRSTVRSLLHRAAMRRYWHQRVSRGSKRRQRTAPRSRHLETAATHDAVPVRLHATELATRGFAQCTNCPCQFTRCRQISLL